MHPSTDLFLVFALILPVLSTPATTEHLRQWILSNRKNSYVENSVNGDGDLAGTILRLFGFGPDKESSTVATTTAGTTTLQLDVCPFSAEPLIIDSEFSYCRPSSVGDCPVGFLCDQSFVLNRSICCRDLKSGKNGILPHRPAPTYSSTSRPSFSWNTITPTQSSPKWSALVSTTKKAPWYIKDRNTWPAVYNRITPETTESEKELPTTIKYTTTTQAITTTTSPSTTEEPTTTKAKNPWGHLWTTTALPRNVVNVSILQAGSMRPLREGQLESVGAITLINDNGFYVLIDTGASSDTERLLHSLSKESVTLDQINTVVITHGHPGHMGNMNFFAQKPILFHSMEYVGRHVTPTALKERPYRKLSQNIEVWKTPGHTQHDLTVLVHNVAGYGTMAVVGDLIPNEQLISEKRDIMLEEGVWDAAIKRQNANLIICLADWVVPGHGQPFRVLPHYRQKAGCTQLLAQRQALNQFA